MDTRKALALVVLGLRTRRRPSDLVTLAEAIEHLVETLGSSKEVARRAGVSPSMLNRFRSVLELHPPVRDLVRTRRIDRVSDAFQLSRISQARTQLVLARCLLDEGLSTHELRDIVSIAIRTRPKDIRPVVRRVIRGRRKSDHYYAVVMPVPEQFRHPKYPYLHVLHRKLRDHGINPREITITRDSAFVLLAPREYARASALARRFGGEVTDLARQLLRPARES